MKYLFYTIFLTVALNTSYGQDLSMYFSPIDVDCVTNTSCYNVLVKSGSEDFKMGSSNLRLFYNAGTQAYVKQSSAVSIQKGYTITNRNVVNQTASLAGKGSISFEQNIGLLDIPIDFRGEDTDAMVINSSEFSVLASNICFQASEKQYVGKSADFVWATEKTKDNYTSAVTTLNRLEGQSTDIASANFSVEAAAELRSDCGASQLLSNVDNYPNPFSEKTQINYSIQHETQVELNVFSMNGKLILRENSIKKPGDYSFLVDKDDLEGAGVYVYSLKTSNNHIQKKMILLK